MITDTKIKELELKAEAIRETIVEMLVAAGSGHTAGPLGMADIFAAFYFHILNHDPANPAWEERDRLFLSNGHIVPVRDAAMFAGANKLHNLTAVIDRNNIQINGMTEDVMPLDDLRKKYKAFNWHVLEIDGHNMNAIVSAVEQAKAIYEKPTLILAHTIPGKGVKEIEFDYRWHGKPPSKEEAKKFLAELRTMKGKIQSEHE